MPERAKFAPMISGVFFALPATIAMNCDSVVRADTPCVEQPPQPVAERPYRIVPYGYWACHQCHAMRTEVLLWTARYDRANGRKCWSLVDANGRDVTAAHVRAAAAPEPAPTLSSKLASLWADFTGAWPKTTFWADLTGAPPKATPESKAPQISAPNPSHKTQIKSANADNGVREGQRSSGEGHVERRVSSVPPELERDPLFQEFLRWREREKIMKTFSPPPSTQ